MIHWRARVAAEEIGRFAPSPTGPLHLGSLLTARRELCRTRGRLAAAGWCGWKISTRRGVYPVLQTRSSQLSISMLCMGWTHVPAPTDRVVSRGARTPSRQRSHLCVHVQQKPGSGERRLPRHLQTPGSSARRAALDSIESAGRNDRVARRRFKGAMRSACDADVGDFVIFRRDRVIAYQLAVVVDDAAQRITHVVRGADLLDNTPRQLLLFRLDRCARPALRARPGAIRSQRPEAQQTDARDGGRRRLTFRESVADPRVARPRAAQGSSRGQSDRVADLGRRTMGYCANSAARNSLRVRVHLKTLCYHRRRLPGGGDL